NVNKSTGSLQVEPQPWWQQRWVPSHWESRLQAFTQAAAHSGLSLLGQVPGCSGVKIVTRQYVFQKTKGYEEKDFGKKLDLVEQELISDASFPIDQKNKFIHTFSHLKAEMKSKWQTAKRTETVFLKKYQKWLQGTLEIPKNVTNKHLVGRPHKVFEDLAECSKRRKTTHLRSENEAESLIYAGQMALREKGNVDAAHVVKDVMSSPTRGYKYRQAFRKSHTPEKRNTQLTPTEALSMFVEASLTRNVNKSTGSLQVEPQPWWQQRWVPSHWESRLQAFTQAAAHSGLSLLGQVPAQGFKKESNRSSKLDEDESSSLSSLSSSSSSQNMSHHIFVPKQLLAAIDVVADTRFLRHFAVNFHQYRRVVRAGRLVFAVVVGNGEHEFLEL
ncbi:hypothetical protein MSG28_007967, partial [Choristoneura fumiferana]